MSVLVLKDTTVELSTRDDESLKGMTHLVLEVNMNGRVVGKANLVSQMASPWKWDTDQIVVIDRNERRVIAFMELNSLELCNTSGSQYGKTITYINEHGLKKLYTEVPLMTDENYPNLVLRTSTMTIENIEKFVARAGLNDIGGGLSHTEGTIEKVLADARSTYEDFKRHGKLESLEQEISKCRTVMEVIPEDDPKVPAILNCLGVYLRCRFEQVGCLDDIHEAIERLEIAIFLTPDDDSNKPSFLTNLGNALARRFEHAGTLDDLENAIRQHQTAVHITRDGDPERPGCLNNLGRCLRVRFEQLGRLNDIEDAIVQLKQAVGLTPDTYPDKPMYLTNLGGALHARFEHSGDIADIDGAIAQQQLAVRLISDDHPNKSGYLSNLGNSLQERFQRLENFADLDNAILHQHQAVNLTPDSHPDKPRFLNSLGNSLDVRFRRLGNRADIDHAILQYQKAVNLAPAGHTDKPMWLTNLGTSLGERFNHFGDLDDINNAMVQLHMAVDLTPDSHPNKPSYLGNLGASLHHRFIRLGNLSDLENLIKTQEQALELTPGTHSDKARRLLNLALSFEYRALTAEWEKIINQIRSFPGFEGFLRPPTSSQLMNTVQDGPVVVLNVAKNRCDALALVPGLEDVVHIPLPNITSNRVSELCNGLKDQLYSSGVRMRDTRAAKRVPENADKETCRRVLAELWTNLVKPPHPDVLPRIWWCTTGPLAFLPIHAAGIYGSDSDDLQLSSYAISSYIPTVSTLLEPVKSTATSSFNLLSVIQSSAPGASAILSTKKELEYIRQRLGTRGHVVLEGPAGTKMRVMEGMKYCNWLHLACHGTQKADEPTKSGLLLDDGHLTLEEIIKFNLPHAEFAFLSACQTTTGDESLSEEAVHIAGGMLLAGYRSVVATMWSIQDELAPMVTDEFYGHIMKDGERPDPRKAAEALYMAVQKLRQQPGVQLIDWIPFVHLGV
ncbi:TPR-like protein [Serendipita vermifera]|nr:TPR-like protein [Serendipita vermifera]